MADSEENISGKDQLQMKRKVMKRYSWIYVCISVMFVVVLLKACYIIVVQGSVWRELGQRNKADSLIVQPNRGNILDCNGKLMASTIPVYRLYMDFSANGLTDELFRSNVDSLSLCLARFYGDRSAADFKRLLLHGRQTRSRWFRIDDKMLNYTQYKQVKQFPLFRLSPNKSGMCWETKVMREKPFGVLASRTIGNIFADAERGGYCGLEKGFDDFLAGKPGLARREKKAGRYLLVNEVDPEDGLDVMTTIDINMQDITEDALYRWMDRTEAERGCAVVMEVNTGEVKAIANLQRTKDGQYAETENFAVNSLTEPGSTFKTASVMVALDDGKADTSEIFDTGFGEWRERDWRMTDHNVVYDAAGNLTNKGGFHNISLAQAIWYSSNIGIAKMVQKYYGDKPWDFVNRLYDMKLNQPMNISIPGYATPIIKNPDSKGWTSASLLWMSFGYGVQIPPIYTLAFYNGIANDGKMISPLFVKAVCKNGNSVQTFSPDVVNSSLCSQSTLDKIHQMLKDVMVHGTGFPFKSDNFEIAGKTGTAQTNYWEKDKSKRSHQLSFCGYFPADKPQYSCIVVIWHPHQSLGWGSPSGFAFRDIAERIYARSPHIERVMKEDDTQGHLLIPTSLDGQREPLENVLDELDIPYMLSGDEKAQWASTSADRQLNKIQVSSRTVGMTTVPSVTGMGAKDAVYLLESRGLRVQMNGYGRVVQQSIPAYSAIRRGEVIGIQLRP